MNKNRRFESKNHITQGYSIGFDLNQTGTLLASGSLDGFVYIYNTSNGKLFDKIDAFNKQIMNQPCMDAKFQSSECLSNTYSSNCSQERQYLAVSSINGPIKIYEF
jgi:WD40 repeat protein